MNTKRYGHVLLMADQDHDGSHIKGLVMNYFHQFWPDLLEKEGIIEIAVCCHGKPSFVDRSVFD